MSRPYTGQSGLHQIPTCMLTCHTRVEAEWSDLSCRKGLVERQSAPIKHAVRGKPHRKRPHVKGALQCRKAAIVLNELRFTAAVGSSKPTPPARWPPFVQCEASVDRPPLCGAHRLLHPSNGNLWQPFKGGPSSAFDRQSRGMGTPVRPIVRRPLGISHASATNNLSRFTRSHQRSAPGSASSSCVHGSHQPSCRLTRPVRTTRRFL
jgi:hypothetical protein